jgi:hypothetical protein
MHGLLFPCRKTYLVSAHLPHFKIEYQEQKKGMKTMHEYVPDVNLIAHDLEHRMQGIHTDKHIWKDITETRAYRNSSISLSNVLLCPCNAEYDVTYLPFLCSQPESILTLLLQACYFIFIK